MDAIGDSSCSGAVYDSAKIPLTCWSTGFLMAAPDRACRFAAKPRSPLEKPITGGELSVRELRKAQPKQNKPTKRLACFVWLPLTDSN